MNPRDAHHTAYARVYGMLQAQAATLSFIDTYWILAVGAGIMFGLSFLLKKNVPGGGGERAVG
jgi:DHA2 family multidrug resistance protein